MKNLSHYITCVICNALPSMLWFQNDEDWEQFDLKKLNSWHKWVKNVPRQMRFKLNPKMSGSASDINSECSEERVRILRYKLRIMRKKKLKVLREIIILRKEHWFLRVNMKRCFQDYTWPFNVSLADLEKQKDWFLFLSLLALLFLSLY